MIEKLKAEFSEILKESDPEEIREFFKPTENLEELSIKVIMYGHIFLPKYFYKPTPEFHYELVNIFFRKGNDYTACPRGFSKTTLIQLCVAYSCVHGLDEFIVLIEKTFTEAAEVLEAIREEFKMNDEILRVYGDLTKVNVKGKNQDNIRDSTGDFFVNGVRLRAKGFDTPIRGLKSRHSRPTRVCQPKGQKVLTQNGVKDVSKIVKGDKVLSHTGKFQPVIEVKKLSPKRIYEFHTYLQPTPIQCSERHYMYSKTYGGVFGPGRFSRYIEPDFLPIEALKKGSVIGFPINRNIVNKTVVEIPKHYIKIRDKRGQTVISGCRQKKINTSLTESECYILGQYLGDGSIGQNRIVIYCNSKKLNIIEKIKKSWPKAFERDGSPGVTNLYICSSKLCYIAKSWKQKKNSWKVMTPEFELFPINLQNKILEGYKDADGCKGIGNNRITSVCLPLLEQWQRILLRQGIISSIRNEAKERMQEFPNGQICKTQKKYSLYISKRGGKRYKQTTSWIENDYLWTALSENPRCLNNRQSVYGMSVSKDKSYCGHLMAHHNCLDDCESDEHIDNVEQRSKYLNNYIKGIVPAVDNETGTIKMFGTILHDDSLLNTLVENHNGKIYAAWDKKHKLLWPSNWTVKKLEQKREEMRISERGDSAFYQEYFNQPLDKDNQIFRREMFQYFKNLDLPEMQKKPHRIYTIVDPAISKKATADFTAVVTVMVDELNRIFILEITRARLNPMETIRAIFAHYERWHPIYVGIESVSYQKALKFFVEEEKRKQTSTVRTMQVVEIKPTTDKITKIKKLQPKYSMLSVFHNSDDKNTSILEEELLRFPVGVHDDVIDCISYVIEIIIPIQKTVQRSYRKFIKKRTSSVLY